MGKQLHQGGDGGSTGAVVVLTGRGVTLAQGFMTGASRLSDGLVGSAQERGLSIGCRFFDLSK